MFAISTDLWAKGVEAWLSVIGVGKAGDSGVGPFKTMMGAIASLPPRSTASAGDRHDGSGEWHAASGQIAFLSPAIAQAWMVTAGSAVRYWQTLAEVHSRYQGALVQAAVDRASGQAAAPPSGHRVLADELRAYLREIGDSAMLEGRRLQAELEGLGEQIADAADAATPTNSGFDPRGRRHRVKR
jgi:hypothetical protein